MWSPGWVLFPYNWCPYKKRRLGHDIHTEGWPCVDSGRRQPSTHQGERPQEGPAPLTPAQVPASRTGDSACLLFKPPEAVECCYSSPSELIHMPISSKMFFSPPLFFHEMPSLWFLINLVRWTPDSPRQRPKMHRRALSLTRGCAGWSTLMARVSTSFWLLPHGSLLTFPCNDRGRGSRRAERSSWPQGDLNAASQCRESNRCELFSRAIPGQSTCNFQTRCSFSLTRLFLCLDAQPADLIYWCISSAWPGAWRKVAQCDHIYWINEWNG